MAGLAPRLLIVDDNEDNRYTLQLLLEMEGYNSIVVAEDGAQALQALDADRFDLVLLDVMMPRLGGIEVLQEMRARGRLGDPPIIMVSALDELASTVRCIELGAVDYLPKPFEPILLRARVHATLERKLMQDEIKSHRDRMEAELAEARALQMSMCPQTFPTDGPVDIYGMMESAREVGGDFFDVFTSPDGRLAVVIGDVAGKGAPAALFMARTKDVVRLTAEHLHAADGGALEPHEIITHANRRLAAVNPSLTFVTLFFGLLDLTTGDFRYCNAGHDDPYHLAIAGEVRALPGRKGPPLGIRPNHAYATEHLTLHHGDALLIYSDGVTEAQDVANTLYGEARLEALLRDQIGKEAVTIVDVVSNSVRQFAAGAVPADDVTILAMRWM
jgi:sigma-B regulation protein RsbU (phosphoserine phosphatase)